MCFRVFLYQGTCELAASLENLTGQEVVWDPGAPLAGPQTGSLRDPEVWGLGWARDYFQEALSEQPPVLSFPSMNVVL